MSDQELDIEQLKGELSEKAQAFAAHATEFAKQKPHLAVGIAFGVGWVLGNGLPPRVVMAAARLGWKAMLGGALAGTGIMGVLGGNEEVPARSATRPASPKRTGENGATSSKPRTSGV